MRKYIKELSLGLKDAAKETVKSHAKIWNDDSEDIENHAFNEGFEAGLRCALRLAEEYNK